MPKGSTQVRIGRQVEAARRGRGWVLDQVARRTGRGAARISEIETGKANATLETLETVCDALGLSLVLVPTERLEEVLALVDRRGPERADARDLPSVFDELFVDDGEPTEVASARP